MIDPTGYLALLAWSQAGYAYKLGQLSREDAIARLSAMLDGTTGQPIFDALDIQTLLSYWDGITLVERVAPPPTELEKFGAWLDAKVRECVQGLITGTTWLISEITRQMLILRHNVNIAIANAIATPGGALMALIGLVGVGLIAAGAYVVAEESGTLAALKEMVESVKEGTAAILDMLGVRELIATHQLLGIVWEDYRIAWEPINQAISALSSELGYDAGFLTLVNSFARSMVYASLQIMGLGGEWSESNWFDSTQAFLSKAESRFDRYVMHPELVLTDIDREVIAPYLDKPATVMSNLEKAILEMPGKIEAVKGYVDGLIGQANALIGEVSVNADRDIPSWWLDAKKTYDDFIVERYTPAMEGLIESIGIIEGYLNETRTIVDVLPRSEDLAAIDARPELEAQADGIGGVIESLPSELVPIMEAARGAIDLPMPPEDQPVLPPLPTPEAPTEGPVWYVGEDPGTLYSPGGQQADGRSWYMGEGA